LVAVAVVAVVAAALRRQVLPEHLTQIWEVVAVVAVVDEGRELRAPQVEQPRKRLLEHRAPPEQPHLRVRAVTGDKIRKQLRHGLLEGAMVAQAAR
jgi:hypothetical protein